MKKATTLGLSPRDKTPNPSGYGFNFHHTEPQRRVPCVLGDLLAPRSADDIPPISPEAMASVQAALALLADLIADRDHALFMGSSERLEEHRGKARDILLTARGLAGILRVEAAHVSSVKADDHKASEEERNAHTHLLAELEALPAYHGWWFAYEYPGLFCYHHPDSNRSVFFTPDWSEDGEMPIEVQDNEGACVEYVTIALPHEGRTGAKIFDLVKPTLDKFQPQSKQEIS